MKEGRFVFKGGKCFVVTFCHFLSLLITFCHFWTNFWEVSQACFVHTNASARHCDTIVLCIQTGFLQKYLFKTTKRCECSLFVTFLSLLITFCHFWNNVWEVLQACFVHTNACARHCDTIVLCIQTGFLQKYLFKTTKRCECSLSVTFCHF